MIPQKCEKHQEIKKVMKIFFIKEKKIPIIRLLDKRALGKSKTKFWRTTFSCGHPQQNVRKSKNVLGMGRPEGIKPQGRGRYIPPRPSPPANS